MVSNPVKRFPDNVVIVTTFPKNSVVASTASVIDRMDLQPIWQSATLRNGDVLEDDLLDRSTVVHHKGRETKLSSTDLTLLRDGFELTTDQGRRNGFHREKTLSVTSSSLKLETSDCEADGHVFTANSKFTLQPGQSTLKAEYTGNLYDAGNDEFFGNASGEAHIDARGNIVGNHPLAGRPKKTFSDPAVSIPKRFCVKPQIPLEMITESWNLI